VFLQARSNCEHSPLILPTKEEQLVLETMSSWITGVASAVTIKLSSSIDDVVWLAPFLTTNTKLTARLQNGAVYIGVCLLQTIVAIVLAYSGDHIVSMVLGHSDDRWSTDKILTVGAGAMLGLYSIKLAHEYWEEMQEDDDSDKSDEDSEEIENGGEQELEQLSKPSDKIALSREDTSRDLKKVDSTKNGDKKECGSLFVIAFLGSVDDLTLFVPMLVGKGFDFAQLMLGAFSAASAIVVLCMFIGLCKPVANLLSAIPLALIVSTFAVALLTKGAMMD